MQPKMDQKAPRHPMNAYTKLYLQFLAGYGLFVLATVWLAQ